MPTLPPIQDQARYWDQWNQAARDSKLPGASARQGAEVEAAVEDLSRGVPRISELRILDVGCGIGWLCERLTRYGRVTGTDMTQSSLDKARARLPQVQFICGDFFELALPEEAFDVVTSLEVLSHVADQTAFVSRLAMLLKPGGLLILSTQNRPVFERWSAIPRPDPSQIRRWVDHRELRALLAPRFQRVAIRSIFPVGDRGLLRFVNSVKLNRLIQRVVPSETVQGWKESAMLGSTLMAFARKRGDLA